MVKLVWDQAFKRKYKKILQTWKELILNTKNYAIEIEQIKIIIKSARGELYWTIKWTLKSFLIDQTILSFQVC